MHHFMSYSELTNDRSSRVEFPSFYSIAAKEQIFYALSGTGGIVYVRSILVKLSDKITIMIFYETSANKARTKREQGREGIADFGVVLTKSSANT
eukprot:15365895-Ditylum_brightwellii.AAC.1